MYLETLISLQKRRYDIQKHKQLINQDIKYLVR